MNQEPVEKRNGDAPSHVYSLPGNFPDTLKVRWVSALRLGGVPTLEAPSTRVAERDLVRGSREGARQGRGPGPGDVGVACATSRGEGTPATA